VEELLHLDACALPTADRPVRLAEFDDVFRTSVRSVERGDGLVRLRMPYSGDLRDHVRDLTARESECCSFFEFAVSEEDDELVLEVRVPPERLAVLDGLAARAQELSA
jgi:hypothetical protein